ncbi:hypothetical protein [Orlajensenia leifsoniae]|uniref:Uncharacterized protein n=1 Tax=Orlajensenia leifsoniae TaxID=2561933 RepID=A0A4Y9R889_9MICO|nr:hypothetical protein [Leifsonia flava]TFV99883.1 hypothetical protein E4M00_01375 [Leifsonia flava]
MPSEDDLRRQLHDDAARSTYTDAAHTIDVSQAIQRTRGRRRVRMLLASSGTALALVGIAVTAAFGVPALTSQYTTPPPFAATPTDAPDPNDSVAPRDQDITPTPETQTAPTVTIPTDCSAIYTKDWTPDFGGLVLNPERPGDDSQKYAALDDVFGPTLQANSKLGCLWASADPGSDEVGLRTEVASLTPELQATLIEHAETSGYACADEFGGTRCDIESEAEVAPDEARSGTMHFFRDGIWVSTWWLRINPPGYTEDIEKALFGAPESPGATEDQKAPDVTKIVVRPEMLQLLDAGGVEQGSISYDAEVEGFVALFTDLTGADPAIEEHPGGMESWPSTSYTWDGVRVSDDHEGKGPMDMNVDVTFSTPELGPANVAVSTIQGFQPGDDLAWLAEYMDEPYNADSVWHEVQAEHGPVIGPQESETYSNSNSVVGRKWPNMDGSVIFAPWNLGIGHD